MWGRSVKTARILVIDDSAVTRKLVRIALSSEGYEVVEAEDGQRGIEAFSRYRPDLVLQDLLLPDVDGTDLMLQLRALPGGKHAAILAHSGWEAGIVQARREDVGFTAYLVKPVPPSELIVAIRAVLLPTRTGGLVLRLGQAGAEKSVGRIPATGD
jgi:two-component system KDP operon response regulator KdpE